VAQIKPKSDSENWHSLNRNRWHSYTEMGGTNRTVLSNWQSTRYIYGTFRIKPKGILIQKRIYKDQKLAYI